MRGLRHVQLGSRDCGSSWDLCLNILVLTTTGKHSHMCMLHCVYRAGESVFSKHSSSLTSAGHKDLVVMTNRVML